MQRKETHLFAKILMHIFFSKTVFIHTYAEEKHLFQLKMIFFQRDPEHQQLHKAGCEEIVLLKFCNKIYKVARCLFNINPKQRSV